MSGELRTWLRNAVSEARRARVDALIQSDGCDTCDLCGAYIKRQLARKRFCSERHRVKWAQTYWVRPARRAA